MKQVLKKNRVLTVLLAALLVLVLFPAPALAASATGTATATQGYSSIYVSLTGSAEFSADETAVENIANWTLVATGGTQTITSVAKTGATTATIALSAAIGTGNAFTLNAAAAVFAAGTDPFSSPLDVSITPNYATGTATATAGTKNISVALTNGGFSAANAGIKLFWTLGGASAASNPIASATYVDYAHATLTLTNSIDVGDEYTVTAVQAAFVNAAVAPFASALPVTVSAAPSTDITSQFDPGFLVWVRSVTGKTAGQPIYDTDVSGIVSLSVTNKYLTSLAGIQYFTGLEALYCSGNFLTSLDVSALTSLTTLYCGNNQLGSLNVGALTEMNALDCSGNHLTGLDVTGLAKLTTLNVSGNYMADETAVIGLNEATTTSFTFAPQNTPGDVCRIGSTQYGSLNEALVDVPHNGTVTMLKNFNQVGGIRIFSKTVTIDLSGYTLNVINGSGTGLEVTMGGELKLMGAGALNVASHGTGVAVTGEACSATVTNVTSDDVGASASAGGVLTVNGDVAAQTTGVSADGTNSEITVTGAVTTAGAAGASAQNGAKVTVGNILAANGTGAVAYGGGEATVEGTITANTYVSVGASVKTIDEKTPFTTKPGYSTYTDGVSTVWVKDGSPVQVTTTSVSAVAADGAQLAAGVTNPGGGSITQRGFVYATHAGPTAGSDTIVQAGVGTGSFTASLTGLSSNTLYYVRAYAILSGEAIYYGNEVQFTTLGFEQATLPAVVTDAVSSITTSGAALFGSVTSDGGATVTERGFVYSLSANPTTANAAKVTAGGGTGAFTATLSGLAAGTTYHVRAYATNVRGTSYGENRSFATQSGGVIPNPPTVIPAALTVVTDAVSGVTASGAMLSGSVTADGGAAVTERGFVYGKASSPSLPSDKKAVSGSGTGSFTATLSGLDLNTKYYVRAYAISGGNVTYGANMNFQTSGVGVPNTGDSSAPWFDALLMAAAAAVGIAAVKKTRLTAKSGARNTK